MSPARQALSCLGLHCMSRFGRPDRENRRHVVLQWKGTARVHYKGRALHKRGLPQSDLHPTEWKGSIQTSSLIALGTQPQRHLMPEWILFHTQLQKLAILLFLMFLINFLKYSHEYFKY